MERRSARDLIRDFISQADQFEDQRPFAKIIERMREAVKIWDTQTLSADTNPDTTDGVRERQNDPTTENPMQK